MKLDEQAEIVRYLEKLYLSNGGFRFRYIGDDAIKLYHDDGTETIFKVIDGTVKAVSDADATKSEPDNH